MPALPWRTWPCPGNLELRGSLPNCTLWFCSPLRLLTIYSSQILPYFRRGRDNYREAGCLGSFFPPLRLKRCREQQSLGCGSTLAACPMGTSRPLLLGHVWPERVALAAGHWHHALGSSLCPENDRCTQIPGTPYTALTAYGSLWVPAPLSVAVQEYPSGLGPPKKAFNGKDLVTFSEDLLEPGKNWQTGTPALGSTAQNHRITE